MIAGILVNPEDHTVEIRQLNQAPVVLQDSDVLTVPDLLPGGKCQSLSYGRLFLSKLFELFRNG